MQKGKHEILPRQADSSPVSQHAAGCCTSTMESLPHPNVLHISESCGWPHSLKTLTAYLGHANGITVSSIASDKMDDADSRQQTIEEPNSLNELDSVYDLIMLSASKARDPNTTMEILQTYQSLLFATLGCVISGDRVSNACVNYSHLLFDIDMHN